MLTITDNPIVELLPKSTRGRFKVHVPISHRLINGDTIIIDNFVSNGASVPKILWGIYSNLGTYVVPAIIHDYLYDNNLYSREFADRQFLLDMGVTNTKKSTKWIFYWTVRIFGAKNWNN
jgi:hypothetical protein